MKSDLAPARVNSVWLPIVFAAGGVWGWCFTDEFVFHDSEILWERCTIAFYILLPLALFIFRRVNSDEDVVRDLPDPWLRTACIYPACVSVILYCTLAAPFGWLMLWADLWHTQPHLIAAQVEYVETSDSRRSCRRSVTMTMLDEEATVCVDRDMFPGELSAGQEVDAAVAFYPMGFALRSLYPASPAK